MMFTGQSRRPWFLGLDDGYDFGLLQTSLYSARVSTSLQPHVLHTGLHPRKLDYLRRHGVLAFEVQPDRKIANGERHPGALLRMYIPKVAPSIGVTGTVLYTDADVMFFEDPPNPAVAVIAGSSYTPNLKSSVTDIVNSGVLYLNVDELSKSVDDFLAFALAHPKKHNAAAESIYNHYYDVEALSYRYNFFSYWDRKDLARPIIMHFHGPKPNSDSHHDVLAEYLTPHFHRHRELWAVLDQTRRHHGH